MLSEQEDILARVQKNLTVEPSPEGEEIKAQCPFCADQKFHLYINTEKKVYHCFRCDAGGSLVNLVSVLEDIPEYKVRAQYYQKYKAAAPPPENLTPVRKAVRKLDQVTKPKPIVNLPNSMPFPEFFVPLWKDLGMDVQPYKEYLYGRGITDSIIRRYRLGCCPFGFFKNRVIIPVYMNKVLVGYQGRDITNTLKPKVLNPQGFQKANCLFNYDQASKFDEVFVVEGPFGAMHVGPNAVATFGKAISKAQIRLLEPFQRITLILDDDAWEAALRAASLFENPNVFVLLLQKGQPDHYDQLKLMDMVKQDAIWAHSPKALQAQLSLKLGVI